MALKSIIATVQGKEYELTLNPETGYYERVLSPLNDKTSFHQPGGYFPVSITATDTTGLSATVDSADDPNLRLFVAEKHKPKIIIISPSSDAYITETARPEIQFKVIDNEYPGYSGINKDSIVLKANGLIAEGVVFEEIEGGYLCRCTPDFDLPDGDIFVTIDAADNDGNAADTVTETFKIDNSAPELDVTSPLPGFETSNSTLVVSGTTNDTSKPIVVSISLNGIDKGTTAVNEDGSFSMSIDLKTQGDNYIVVTATDATGKSTSVERIVKYNTNVPVFAEVQLIFDGNQVSETNKVPATSNYTIRCKVTTS